MHLESDIARIEATLAARMARGWLDGDPATLTVRPLTRLERRYLIQYAADGIRYRWLVDGSLPGLILQPAGACAEEGDRPDVLVATILRVLKARTPENYRRGAMHRLRLGAQREGFDFATLYQLAVRQLGAFPEDMATLLDEMTGGAPSFETAEAA
jgi:hypothetical protein